MFFQINDEYNFGDGIILTKEQYDYTMSLSKDAKADGRYINALLSSAIENDELARSQ
jgi:hypothetical protein